MATTEHWKDHNYYGNWKQESIGCPECGWHGVGDACARGELFPDMFELCCPACGKSLTAVLFPTIEESRQNGDKLGETDRLAIDYIEMRRADVSACSLKNADQLPDIEEKEFSLTWSVEGSDLVEDTVISLGDRCLWREPSGYENYWRFIEIAEMLKQRYGSRVKDLVPTRESELSLYGDRLSSPQMVEVARGKLAGNQG